MTNPAQFTKFPRTPHLFWLGDGKPRGDKLLDPEICRTLMARSAVAEEKVDGANLGLSLDEGGRLRAQNRGAYIAASSHAQFRPLGRWLVEHDGLREALGGLILFGEWCYARHTVAYDALPDWFIAFDVFDLNEARFWSRRRRDALCALHSIATVPLLGEGVFDARSIERLIGPSKLGAVPAEGIVLRWDEGDWLGQRAKVVRPAWVQPDEEHWASRPIEPNQLARGSELSA